MDFTGSTKYRFKKSEKDRKYFLTINGNTKIPFFGVWMSRDVIYIAPQDTQKEIIEKWKKWYFISGKTFEYNPVEDIDKWYF